MTIRLAAPLQIDSVVDGYGIRTVLWTQGCSHNCPFCQNPGTHDFDGGYVEEVSEVLKEIKGLKNQDGITLSGGDPVFQIDAITKIAKYTKSLGMNVWCYTGFLYEDILKMAKGKPVYLEFLENVDVLVDGKFEIENKSYDVLFRGSTNQRLIDVPLSLKRGHVVNLREDDGIMSNFKKEVKMYI